jgi:multisite-specific tRNA:(cytosine-C5)-methyltransferase
MHLNTFEGVTLLMQVCDKGKSLVSCKEVPKVRRSVVLPSMFPNGGSYRDIDCNGNCDVNGHSEDGVQTVENPVMHEFAEEVSDFPLERCMRLLPHDQNSGAFFIAVLQKKSPLPGYFSYDSCCVFLSLKSR